MARTKNRGWLILGLFLAGCSRERLVIVGCKDFTEQEVLGEIVAQHVEHRLRRPVYRKFGLGGTLLVQQGLRSGQIDVYPEYTGTAFTIVLKQKPLSDPAAVLAQLRDGYAKWGLEWLDPLGFNNAFAMAVRGEDARARHLETLSDAARDPGGFRLGVGYEFLGRPDGYELLTRSYPIKWTAPVKSMTLGLIYQALREKQVSMIAGSVTDGPLAVMDAKVLADDKHVFPPYQACLVSRSGAWGQFPGLREAMVELSAKIGDDAMRRMNYEVDGKHRRPAEVAREFLRGAGL